MTVLKKSLDSIQTYNTEHMHIHKKKISVKSSDNCKNDMAKKTAVDALPLSKESNGNLWKVKFSFNALFFFLF